jgi:hypothetical protein
MVLGWAIHSGAKVYSSGLGWWVLIELEPFPFLCPQVMTCLLKAKLPDSPLSLPLFWQHSGVSQTSSCASDRPGVLHFSETDLSTEVAVD